MKKIVIFNIFLCIQLLSVCAQQDTLKLNLSKAIDIALDSSLSAFKAENLYLTSHWRYHNFRAQRLPSLDLITNPVSYNRAIDRQYSFSDSGFVFVQDQSLYSQLGLQVNQKLTATNGEFYINTDLSRLHNIASSDIQFSATPLSVGYRQPLFGYNEYKWQKKTEPLQYEKAKKELAQSSQNIILELIPLYFSLLQADLNVNIARQKLANADTLYSIGQQRFKIAGIDKADLLTLKLEYINAKNEAAKAGNELERAKDALRVFLKLDESKSIHLALPNILPQIYIDPDKALQIAQQQSPFYLGLQVEQLMADGEVERARRESMLNASLNASFGLNQQADQLSGAYSNLLDQQIVSLNLRVPLVDWGVRKSQYNMAKSERNVKIIEIEQEKQNFRQDLVQTVHEFNLQKDIYQSSLEAAGIAKESYQINIQRFLLGKIDINTLTLQQNRQEEALRMVIQEMEKYWNYYYTIQKQTLYDFKNDLPVSETIDNTKYVNLYE